ncbi:MAG: 16S rRNA (cytosine(967)-C(5))-methyltransferase RsmB [Chromatiales bacterium]
MAEKAVATAPQKSVRSVAAMVLDQVRNGQSLSRLLPQYGEQVRETDRALLSELAYGACRWFHQLEAIKQQLLNKPLRKRDALIDSLIIIGLYQLMHTRIKPHAIVAETVNAVRHLGRPMLVKLVNGVLRRFQREQQQLLDTGLADDAARYAMPSWLVDAIRQAWPQHWADMLQAMLQRPPLTLRVNRLRIDVETYRNKLRQVEMSAIPVAGAPQALQLETAVDVSQLPGFFDGEVSVQDAGAQLAAQFLDLHAGMSVLDACAAPGGKTGHVLESVQPLRVTAIDVDDSRLQRVRENLSRLQLEADVVLGDAASDSGDWRQQQYDRILLDVPCSATGVIRRHPDIKLLRRPEDIDGLVTLQRCILNNIWPLLKPGGQLLYATCSLLPQENQQQVEWFLSQQTDAYALPLTYQADVQACSVGIQVLPGTAGMDGFYYARLGRHET